MRDAVIVSAVRTPLGRRQGQLKGIHPTALSVLVMGEALKRVGVAPDRVDQVIWGCANQVGEQASNIARIAWLAGGFSAATAGTTVDNRCGSGENAIHLAAALIRTGAADVAASTAAQWTSSASNRT